MIKANELRVGSLYLNRSTVDDFKENAIAKDREDWNGIPLNSDWLQRMGFDDDLYLLYGSQEDQEYMKYYLKDQVIRLWSPDGCTTGLPIDISCKYVHQLQNLFFVLTGTELEIKMP